MVCPVDGMTKPCAHSDLPSSYDPIVKYQGSPSLEYNFPDYARPDYYTMTECLRLNSGYTNGRMDDLTQTYFFGELIPPYIDVLGRGPYFRSTDALHLKYQRTAKCYRNTQRFGSPAYQRMAEYLGPQYEIQNLEGLNYQGYSKVYSSNGSAYYSGFFGPGSLYIDLPHARKFEPSYNCTRGIRLMNETRIIKDDVGLVTTVYTDSVHDPLASGASRTIALGKLISFLHIVLICNSRRGPILPRHL